MPQTIVTWENRLQEQFAQQNKFFKVDVQMHLNPTHDVRQIFIMAAEKVNAALTQYLPGKDIKKAIMKAKTQFANVVTNGALGHLNHIPKGDAKMINIGEFERSNGDYQLNVNQISGSKFEYTVKFIIYANPEL